MTPRSKNRGAAAQKYESAATPRRANAFPDAVDVDKPVTPKQHDFVRLWASGESILSASERAGFNDRGTTAYRLTKQANIQRLYHEEKAKYEAAADINRRKVMEMLMEAYDMAKLMAEPATMVSAAREIGKMCGYYAPSETRIKIEGNVVMEKMAGLSDAELLDILLKQPEHAAPAPAPDNTPLLVDETGEDDGDS